MELTEIKSKGTTWGKEATSLNNNFSKISTDVEKLKYATTKVKGFFSSETALKASVSQASDGDIAYVGTEIPYQIWEWKTNKWVNSGKTEDKIEVNLGDYYNKEEVDNKIKPTVFDGGRADSVYGGSMVIDCGTAYHS